MRAHLGISLTHSLVEEVVDLAARNHRVGLAHCLDNIPAHSPRFLAPGNMAHRIRPHRTGDCRSCRTRSYRTLGRNIRLALDWGI